MTEEQTMITDVVGLASITMENAGVVELEEFEQTLKYQTKERLGMIKARVKELKGNTLDACILGLRKEGLLKVTPRLVMDGEFPFLMFSHDRFLSWFRGYGFQVSGDEEGQGAFGDSGTNLAAELSATKGLEGAESGIVAFGSMIEAAMRYPEFRWLVENEPEQVEEFMTLTHQFSGIGLNNFIFRELLNLVEKRDELPGRPIYRQLKLVAKPSSRRKGGVFGTLVLGHGYVALKRVGADKWSITRFNTHVGERFKHLEGNAEYSEYIKTMYRRLSFILCFTERVFMNFMYVYPEGSATYLPEVGVTPEEAITKSWDLDDHIEQLVERWEHSTCVRLGDLYQRRKFNKIGLESLSAEIGIDTLRVVEWENMMEIPTQTDLMKLGNALAALTRRNK